MRSELFQPTPEGEARLLLLIHAFTTKTGGLEGRTKLAKLDFLLRYPTFLRRALAVRAPEVVLPVEEDADLVDTRMVRYRYGPWDPAYFALLGALIGRGLVVPIVGQRGITFRTTEQGNQPARALANSDAWGPIAMRARLLKRHFDLSGTTLKEFIYANFPEVTRATWGEAL